MEKSTEEEVTARVEQIMLVMLDGGEFHDIRQFAANPGEGKEPWGVCDRTLFRYMERAWDLIAEQMVKDRPKLIAREILSSRRMQATAIQQGDIRTAFAVAKDMRELIGLYPDKKPDKPKDKPLAGRVEELLSDPAFREVLANAQQWQPAMLSVSEPEKEQA